MSSIYRIGSERDFPFQSDFDFRSISRDIDVYKASSEKSQEWYDRIMRNIATSECFKELRILLINKLENE